MSSSRLEELKAEEMEMALGAERSREGSRIWSMGDEPGGSEQKKSCSNAGSWGWDPKIEARGGRK